MNVSFSIKKFDELSLVDLYYILQARSQVFVVEQFCAYQDIDELDFDSLHLVAHQNKSLIGYCRIIPPNVIANENSRVIGRDISPNPRISRVLVLPDHRGMGLARDIMNRAIKYCRSKYGKRPISIAAQTYLLDFYQSLGFEPISEPFMEDGLEHIDMILEQKKRKAISLPSIGGGSGLSAKSIIINLFLFIVAAGIMGLLYLLI